MPVTEYDLASLRARIARATRTVRETGTEEAKEAVRSLKRDYAAAKIEHYITATVEAWPPLTAEQRDRLAVIIRGGRS